MGLSQSAATTTDPKQVSEYSVEDFFQFPSALQINCPVSLSTYSPYPESCQARTFLFESFSPSLSPLKKQPDALLRSMGSFMGMLVGDAFGAPLEFSPLRYNSKELTSFSQVDIWESSSYNKFRLKPGQWTDDAAMGLCLADCLILNNGYSGEDCRLRYHNWWTYGYNNAFARDTTRGDQSSVGLGGNISESMREFRRVKKGDETKAGDKNTSGNGSIMRNASVPIYYHRNPTSALEVASKQSLATHQGTEAAECCRLLTHCVILGIKTGSKDFLDTLSDTFTSDTYSIQCLVKSVNEERCQANESMDLKQRKWNWRRKKEQYKYSKDRSTKQSGYIGSYCMDAMAMALHCIYTTTDFEEALIKVVNLRGDSDSVGSVVGQIAGAIYGIESIPEDWRKTVLRWEVNKGDTGLRVWCLYHAQDEDNDKSIVDIKPIPKSEEPAQKGADQEKAEEATETVQEDVQQSQENPKKRKANDDDAKEEEEERKQEERDSNTNNTPATTD